MGEKSRTRTRGREIGNGVCTSYRKEGKGDIFIEKRKKEKMVEISKNTTFCKESFQNNGYVTGSKSVD